MVSVHDVQYFVANTLTIARTLAHQAHDLTEKVGGVKHLLITLATVEGALVLSGDLCSEALLAML